MKAATCASRRVLVVDDHPDSVEIIGMLLGLDGHEVATAGNAQQAIETAEQFAPQVAILDIGLPGIDGFELATRLRGRAEGIFLIALTGRTENDMTSRCRNAGFDEYLVKPITDYDRLRTLVLQS